jgi:hypothetical protein
VTTNDAAAATARVPERRWPMAAAVLVTIVLQVITFVSPKTGKNFCPMLTEEDSVQRLDHR